jgi:hypothetical protein
VFDIQTDIAEHVAAALNVPLGLAPGDALVRDRTANMRGL